MKTSFPRTGARGRARVALRWSLLALALLISAGSLRPGPASAAQRRTPTLSPSNTVIDGPSPDIVGLDGMSIARDGTGGLVYLKDVDGVAHIFASRLLDGTFQAPQQVDVGLAGPSSQPVIAAGQGGLLLIAFINADQLYVAQAADGQSPVGAPSLLFSGAINPSLSMATFGKAYLAFTAVGATDAVRSAFYDLGQWALEADPLNADPAQSAGADTGRPQVVACGDGVGIVAWGEGGHIYTRRVVGTTPSVVYEQADMASLDGFDEVSAGDPMISSGGDSSYAAVAFQESFAVGDGTQSRVLENHLHGSQYDAILRADGAVPGASEGADQPQTAAAEYGTGWVTSEHDQSHQLWGTVLATNEAGTSVERIDSSPNTSAADGVPATAGLFSTLIAWQQTPGISGPAEIRVRYAPDGSDLGPEQVVSSPALGAANADFGLVAGGDIAGDAAIAWVQGTGAGTQIVAAQLYQSPGSFVPGLTFRYARSSEPLLSWSTVAEAWGLPRYSVEFDDVPIDQTYSTQIRTAAPVADGAHTWEVTATNQAGLTTAARSATVFVDTVAPTATIRVTGRRIDKVTQRITLTDSDPGGAAASGIGEPAELRWGDGTDGKLGHTAIHVYRRAGTYTITVTVADRAGNTTIVTHTLTIKPKPKPKPKPKRKRTKKKKKKAKGRNATTSKTSRGTHSHRRAER